MNVLMGKIGDSTGTLWINDEVQEMHQLKNVVGYVPQEDIMLRELTVRENIRYSATVRLPRTWTQKQIDVYVDAVINTLGLTHVQHMQIGDEIKRGISGGQRKRVNIGMELSAAPLVLFCDEPTSGLDASAALMVTSTLKHIASLGVTVVTVLHQPRVEIFEQFDDIILLVPGGRTAFIGEQRHVIPYFQSLGYIVSYFRSWLHSSMHYVVPSVSKSIRRADGHFIKQRREHVSTLFAGRIGRFVGKGTTEGDVRVIEKSARLANVRCTICADIIRPHFPTTFSNPTCFTNTRNPICSRCILACLATSIPGIIVKISSRQCCIRPAGPP